MHLVAWSHTLRALHMCGDLKHMHVIVLWPQDGRRRERSASFVRFVHCRKRSRLHLLSLKNVEAWLERRYQKHREDEQMRNKYHEKIVWWLYHYTTQGVAPEAVSWRASVLQLPVLRMFVKFVLCVCECKYSPKSTQCCLAGIGSFTTYNHTDKPSSYTLLHVYSPHDD